MPYVLLFVSLWDIPDLCPKGTNLGMKPSAPSCPLTLPLYLGLPTEQAESQDTLPGGVASVSVEIQIVPRLLRGSKKYTEDFKGLTLLYELTWRDVTYVLGQTLTPDFRAWVLGEATAFGDEWLECEIRGKREHEIALLPIRSQAVTITEPLSQMYSWRTQASMC